ncbi:MAG: hypothetical protein M3Q86_01365 [Verrucomicrobiota bacterium]|nr:hypothetical protein [Verrucomicrobiota bacterium]
MKTRHLKFTLIATALAVAGFAAKPASADLALLDQFSPGIGQLVSIGVDPSDESVWIYGSFDADLRSYSNTGEFLTSITRPGGSANDVDIEFAPEALTLGATAIPKDTLLFIDGETSVAEIYAVNKETGAVLATLVTAFGASHVVGGAYHPDRDTFFLVQDLVPGTADENLIGEIDPANGDVLNSFQITDLFAVNFGDIEVGANGNLFVVSSNEDRVLELTPTGDFVQYLDLPAGVSGLSGIAFNESGGEAWVSNTSGTVFHLGGFLGDATLLNISTRLQVLAGDQVLIGGFIITGTDPKMVILRAIGPSLEAFGVANPLADPVLELRAADGSLITTNDDWTTDRIAIEATGLEPTDDLESAIVATLDPGSYTAIMSGKNGGTGVGLVEAYDLDSAADSQLANISTRGFVETADNVMIGGFILGGETGSATVLIRAIGPTLTDFGVADALADPTLELRDVQGTLISSNDNWKDSQEDEIEATGLAPQDDLESVVFETLNPGAYTAIVAGQSGGTGVGLVEVYRLP